MSIRVSELTRLDRDAVHLGSCAHVRCLGKRRKERATQLTTLSRCALQAWLKEPLGKRATALFQNVHRGRLSADSVQFLLGKHVHVAHKSCPSLKAKSVSAHVLRHSAGMELLQAGVDCSVIALWLGHEIGRDQADVPTRPPRAPGSCPGEAQAVRARQANPLPAERPPTRLPLGALNDQTSRMEWGCPARSTVPA